MNNFENAKEILENEYTSPNWNEKSGLCPDELLQECVKIEAKPILNQLAKAQVIECILKNAQIEVNPYTLFADNIRHGHILEKKRMSNQTDIEKNEIKHILDRYENFISVRSFDGNSDFGHTCPDWKFLLDNGFTGIADLADKKLMDSSLKENQKDFYLCVKTVYSAAAVFARRLADEANSKKEQSPQLEKTAKSLYTLSKSAPKTFFEALSLICIYYELQCYLDSAWVRSLGGLDSLLWPYYENDIKTGEMTEDEARKYLKYFMWKMRAHKFSANIPFYLCGADENGNDLTNPLTHIILDEYIKLDTHDPKIHIKYHKNIDQKVLKTVAESIRNGRNSFLFMNDEVVENALIKSGAEKKDAHNYEIVGCYEPMAKGELPCTCNGRINIAKAVELTLSDGFDVLSGKQLIEKGKKPLDTFDAFMDAVKEKLRFFADGSMDIITSYEKNYNKIQSAPFLSAATPASFEKGVDIYHGGAKYNNSSINAFGLATAIDAIMAVKTLVYDKKTVTINQLSDALTNNWQTDKGLQLKCKNLGCKYGNNCDEADNIASELCDSLAKCINGKPNGRGGHYRFGTFSIDWRMAFGEGTGATADGRFAKEPLSKNMCASLGADTNGVTALINSVCKIDYTNIPNGTVLDLLLHQSAVKGDDGLACLIGIIKVCMNKGLIALQINILNSDTLKDAMKNPDAHKNLQVRLCGWNVYFVNLSPKEQEEFIKQTEHMA